MQIGLIGPTALGLAARPIDAVYAAPRQVKARTMRAPIPANADNYEVNETNRLRRARRKQKRPSLA